MVEINETEKPTEVTAEEIRKVFIKSRDTFYWYSICGQGFHISAQTVYRLLTGFLSCTTLDIETSLPVIIPKQLMPCKKSADGSKFALKSSAEFSSKRVTHNSKLLT